MNDCPVCYENTELLTFACTHQLCYSCYCKLESLRCPLCRDTLPDLKLVGKIDGVNIFTPDVNHIRAFYEHNHNCQPDTTDLRDLVVLANAMNLLRPDESRLRYSA